MSKLLYGLILVALASFGLHAQETDPPTFSGRYWFDSGSGFQTFSPGSLEISTEGLDEGFHTFNAFISDGNEISSTYSQWFFKRGTKVKENELLTATVYIDGYPYSKEEITVGSNNIVDFALDMNAVDLGTHTLGVILTDANGNSLGYRSSVFMRVPTDVQRNTFSAYYYLDNEYRGFVETIGNNSVMHLDIDASALESGLHSVTTYLVSPHGMASNVRTAWFIKIPEEGEGVKQYTYWLNDELETQKTVVLPEVTNPYSLMTLIDVPVQPFRSKSYTFALEDNAPVYYACNDFKIRFVDPDERVTTASRTFTDTRVKYAPDEITNIDSQDYAENVNIASNAIRLYKFDAEIGDSINVNVAKAAMVEIYSPSAIPLISTYGVDATHNNTLTIRENGTHYLAVHDIANGKTTALNFQHIHKFALLEQNINKTADRGWVEMKVKGNGFDSLRSLSLIGNGTDNNIDSYKVVDNNTLYVLVDLDEINIGLGNYRLKGIFENDTTANSEEIISSSVLEVEAAKPVDISVKIEAPHIAGTPYLAYIHVTNNSNIGMWGIPFNIAAQHIDNGGKIEFMDFGISINEEYKDVLPVVHQTEDLLNTGHSGSFAQTIIPYLAPGSTNTYTIGLTTAPHAIVPLYAWTGTPWSESILEMSSEDYDLSAILEPFEGNLFTFLEFCKLYYQLAYMQYDQDESTVSTTKHRAPSPPPTMSDMRDIANNAAGIAKQSVGTAAGASNGAISTRMEGRNMLLEMTGSNEYVEQMQNTDAGMLMVGNDLMAGADTSNNLIGNLQALDHLLNARNHWSQNVPADPIPPVTPIDAFQSGDPNDITGYISPAGTNHIGIDVRNVSYTIEFENDPEIANASASLIKVTSNIEGSSFDLSTVKANKLKIGEKEMELPEGHHFVKTLDMRPEINAIAELTFDFDSATGLAKWEIRSLDPYTLDATKYMEDGILPVNDSSNRGIGYLTFSVDLSSSIADNAKIEACAEIIFDNNAPISTPVYTNITDLTPPMSSIITQSTEDSKTFYFEVEGSDSGSGIWYYDLYMCRDNSDNWVAVASRIENESFTYTSAEVLENVKFAVFAIDKAGNRQDQTSLDFFAGDVDGNGLIDANDVVVLRNYYLGRGPEITTPNADINADGVIDTQDATGIRNLYLDNGKKIMRKLIKLKR